MAWMPSYTELRMHPKTRKLMLQLGVGRPEAVGLLHLLWAFAMDYAKDGDLSDYTPAEIAAAAEWEGDAVAFVEALVSARFVDNTESGLQLHNWDRYGGKLAKQRASHAAVVRNSRAGGVTSTCESRDDHMTVTCSSRVDKSRVQERGTSPTPPTEQSESKGTPRQNGTNPRAVGTNPRATQTNPRTTGTNPRAAAAASIRADGVDITPTPTPTTPEDIIEAHVCTCIPPEWRDSWREHVRLWRAANPGDRRPEKLAWHQAFFRKSRAHCEENAPPGQEQQLLLEISKTFFEHGAEHRKFGPEIRASGYDASRWLCWAKTGHWDVSRAGIDEEDHTVYFDETTGKCISRAAFERLAAARKNGGNGKRPKPAAPTVTPEGKAAAREALQQLVAAKGLPS